MLAEFRERMHEAYRHIASVYDVLKEKKLYIYTKISEETEKVLIAGKTII